MGAVSSTFAVMSALVAAVPACVAGETPWPDDLVFGRGGWWKVRRAVTVRENAPPATNRSHVAYAVPVGNGPGAVPLVGARIEELRLTDEFSTQLVFSVWSSSGEHLTKGVVPPDATVVLPGISPSNDVHRFVFYADNDRAWPPTETYDTSPSQAVCNVSVSVGAAKRLRLAEEKVRNSWTRPPRGTRWLWRLPVTLLNTTRQPVNGALVSIPVREAARSAHFPVLHVEVGGRAVESRRLGKRLYFNADIPARAVRTAYVYVREALAGEHSVLAPRAAKNDMASETPSEQVLKEEDAEDVKTLSSLPGVRVNGHPRDVETPPPSGGAPQFAVARVSVTRKVFPESPVENATGEFAMSMARNETEELQLAVRSAFPVARLEAAPSALTHESGAKIDLDVGHVEWVRVDTPSAFYSSVAVDGEMRRPLTEQHSEGWTGLWPDPIVPGRACSLPAGCARAIRFTARTTASTPAGLYRGTLVWRADGREVRRDRIVLKVWSFALPDHPELPAIFDFSGTNRRWWRDGEKTSWPARERMWKFMAEKKLCPNGLSARCYFGRGKDGRVRASFKEWDRAADAYFGKYGFPRSYMPENFWIFGWAHPPRPFLGEAPYEGTWPYDDVDRSKLRPAYRQVYQQALRVFLDHVEERGLSGRFELYISDEPYYSVKRIITQMKALCEMVHEVDPKIRIYASTWHYQPRWNGCIDIWGAGHYGIFPMDAMAARQAAGDEIWYTTDAQLCLDTIHATTERLFAHFCAAYGVKAWENWGIGWFTGDPWETACHRFIRQCGRPGVRNRWVRYPNGDGYLAYPPKEGVCGEICSSLRVESAREGVEDYSYLKRIEECAADASDPQSAKASDLLRRFRALVPVPNAGGRFSTRILPVPEKLESLREEAGDMLCARERRRKTNGGEEK